jgi:hypothetical protein
MAVHTDRVGEMKMNGRCTEVAIMWQAHVLARRSGHRQPAVPPPRHVWSARVRDLEMGFMELPSTHVSFTHIRKYFIIHVAMAYSDDLSWKRFWQQDMIWTDI